MKSDELLRLLATRLGVAHEYSDFSNTTVATSVDTLRALIRANGVQTDNDAMLREALEALKHENKTSFLQQHYIIQSGSPLCLQLGENTQWQLHLAETDTLVAESRQQNSITTPRLESGVYELRATVGNVTESALLLVAPDSAPQILDVCGVERIWGVNAALYGLHSPRNPGPGDYEDLATLATIAGEQGATFLGINPVHALGYAAHHVISPYSPSHRGMLDTTAIALDRIPGLPDEVSEFIRRPVMEGLEPHRQDRLVEYGLHRRLHGQALENLYHAFRRVGEQGQQLRFQHWLSRQDHAFNAFVHFEALSECFGDDWRSWSPEYQQPESPGSRDALAGRQDRCVYHAWLQWVAGLQLSAASEVARGAGMSLGLYLDFAVGSRRGGAESWCEHNATATSVSLGAPPDHLAPAGQNWNLAAWSPHKLRAHRYLPYQRMLRAVMQHAGVLRIDHVLGLQRSFWIPDDGCPGTYVEQPLEVLLALIKIEAERSNTVVIGEDLGLVPPGFRETIRGHGLYGYRVLQYEKSRQGKFKSPGDYHPRVLACFGTHDTATISGFERGEDISAWSALGWIDDAKAGKLRQQRRREVRGLFALAADRSSPVDTASVDTASDNAPGGSLIDVAHTLLAGSPAALVAVQLDDVLGVVAAQNIPGTIDEYPNWRRRLPVPLNKLLTVPGWGRLKHVLKAARR